MIKTFKRYELKYILDSKQFEIIKTFLDRRMVLDAYCMEHGSYMIYNLYFDTDNDDVIRRSLEKKYYKEKLRLRSYEIPKSLNDMIFLELKKKVNGIVAKRRAILTYHEAQLLIDEGKIPETKNYLDQQVLEEIKEFLKRNPVKPKVFISYERLAYFDENDHDFRISFDKNVLTRRSRVNLMDGDFGSELLEDDTYVMEIKLNGPAPLWLCEVLSQNKVYKTSFSKYGMEYRRYAKTKQTEEQGAIGKKSIKYKPAYGLSDILLTV